MLFIDQIKTIKQILIVFICHISMYCIEEGQIKLYCYFILFYFILFYFILFYFILFYFILFYFILFYFILFYFILYYIIITTIRTATYVSIYLGM